MFFVHKPWRGNFVFPVAGWENAFENFITHKHCPRVAKLAHEHAEQCYYDKLKFVECVAKEPVLNRDVDEDMAAFLALTSIHNDQCEPDGDIDDIQLDYGMDYDWTQAKL